jgi:hypothetical protein
MIQRLGAYKDKELETYQEYLKTRS